MFCKGKPKILGLTPLFSRIRRTRGGVNLGSFADFLLTFIELISNNGTPNVERLMVKIHVSKDQNGHDILKEKNFPDSTVFFLYLLDFL